MAMVGVDTSSL